jgi:hypothetical protein
VTNTRDLEVRPATDDGTGRVWADVCEVMQTSGDSGPCFCQWFHLNTAGWRSGTAQQRRAALEGQVRSANPPGVLGYVDGKPAAWCAVAPRSSYERLRTSRKLRAAAVADDDADVGEPLRVWAVTCFVVKAPFRRRGLTVGMLEGAVDLARRGGAEVVEGYPVDVALRGKIGYAELFVGTLPTFLAAGFAEVGRSAPARPVVRRSLSR